MSNNLKVSNTRNLVIKKQLKEFMKIQNLFFVLILIFAGCNTEKLDLDKITGTEETTNNGQINDTVYIKQNPDWTGFKNLRI